MALRVPGLPSSNSRRMNVHKVEFIKSAAEPQGFLDSRLPHIVFAGRSNVGKSSVINSLLNRKNLARVGASPGKTVHVNYFLIDASVYFVDLPGYGYAKASKAERGRWAKLMEAFFSDAARVTAGVLIVDARHKPTADDVTMANWFKSTRRPMIVVANKTDKVNKSGLDANLAVIREILAFEGETLLLPYSAEKGTNRDVLLAEIENVSHDVVREDV